jgi:hypothetical protein
VTWVGLFTAAFSTEIWHLLITQVHLSIDIPSVLTLQGIIAGIGQGMAVPLFMSLPSQWFYKKRGFASGVAIGGAGIGVSSTRTLLKRKVVVYRPWSFASF